MQQQAGYYTSGFGNFMSGPANQMSGPYDQVPAWSRPPLLPTPPLPRPPWTQPSIWDRVDFSDHHHPAPWGPVQHLHRPEGFTHLAAFPRVNPNFPDCRPVHPLKKSKAKPGKYTTKNQAKKARKQERRRLEKALQEKKKQEQQHPKPHMHIKQEPSESPKDVQQRISQLHGSEEKKEALIAWIKSKKVQDKLESPKYPSCREMLKDLAGKEMKVAHCLLWKKGKAGSSRMLDVGVLVGGIKVGSGTAPKERDAVEKASADALEELFGDQSIPNSIKSKDKQRHCAKSSISGQGHELQLDKNEKTLAEEAASKLSQIEDFRKACDVDLSVIPFKEFSGRNAVMRLKSKMTKLPSDLTKLHSCKFLLETMSGVPEKDWNSAQLPGNGGVFLIVPGFDFKVRSKVKKGADSSPDGEIMEKLAHKLMCTLYPRLGTWQQCVFEVVDRLQLKLEERMRADGVPPVSTVTSRAMGAMKCGFRIRLRHYISNFIYFLIIKF